MVVKLHIPENAQLLVTKGQKVKVHEPFYSLASDEDMIIPFAKQLGIKPKDIFKYAKVVVGDMLKEGDQLGERKKVIGTKKVQTENAGTVKHIDFNTGDITIAIPSAKGSEVATFFTGEIVDISDEEHSVSVEIGKADTYEATGMTDLGGTLGYISDKEFFTCGEEDVKDRIILLDTVQSHIETKIEALGAEGVIFTEGEAPSSMPSIKLAQSSDFEKLKAEEDKAVLFSQKDNLIYIY